MIISHLQMPIIIHCHHSFVFMILDKLKSLEKGTEDTEFRKVEKCEQYLFMRD